MTLRDADRTARRMGLKRGRGTYNGVPYWVHPDRPHAIITRNRLAELAGLQETTA